MYFWTFIEGKSAQSYILEDSYLHPHWMLGIGDFKSQLDYKCFLTFENLTVNKANIW